MSRLNDGVEGSGGEPAKETKSDSGDTKNGKPGFRGEHRAEKEVGIWWVATTVLIVQ